MAKIILAFVYLIWISIVTYFQQQGRLSFRLASTLNYLGFLTVLPTLHPWYLLPLLLIGLPYAKHLNATWLWPMMAPLSYFYYYKMQDPFWVRILHYTVITAILFWDMTVVARLVSTRTKRIKHDINDCAVSAVQ